MTTQTPYDFRSARLLLYVLYGMLAFLFSAIQPLAAPADELANMTYAKYLAQTHTLPIWAPHGAEAGYQTQHPPVSYVLDALTYSAFSSLPENMRWICCRWMMIVLGFAVPYLAIKIGQRLFADRPFAAYAYAFAFTLMPMTLYYLSHINPDGVCLILSTFGFYQAINLYQKETVTAKDLVVAGLIAGLAALTKLSAAPIVALLVCAILLRQHDRAKRFTQCGIMLAVWFVSCSWWFIRDKILYGRFFVHTPNTQVIQNGIDGARRAAHLGYAYGGYPGTLRFELQETFLSTWIQRSWLPEVWDILLYSALTILLTLSLVGLIAAVVRKQRSDTATPDTGEPEDSNIGAQAIDEGPPAIDDGTPVAVPTESDGDEARSKDLRRLFLPIAAGFILLEFAGQQIAFWFIDFGWNAGGRYLLQTMPAIVFLVTIGYLAFGRKASTGLIAAWLVLIITMNVVGAKNIVDYLVPHNTPGWRMFEFPAGAGVRDFTKR